MSQAGKHILLALCVGLCLAAPAPAAPPSEAQEQLESYLADRELWGVLSAHLRRSLRDGAADEKKRAAELLGRLYVRMLGEARATQARQELEGHARELLKEVPEAESFELRINLAKAEYLPVEEVVERDRLRLTTPEDRAEAQRVLRHVAPVFEDIAAKVGRKVDQLEKRETQVTDDAAEQVRTELAEARRVRSLARYYAAWTQYYTAVLGNQPNLASKALEDFGYLLNAVSGKAASVERLPENLLRFEHVSRAALGCALCNSLLGRDTEASRWLDAVENAENVPPNVLEQVFSRRLVVYAAAARWADIEAEVRHRRDGNARAVTPLSVAEARLLAILALEDTRRADARPGTRATAERLAQMALGDLVQRGEIGHILSLVTLYGTTPMGEGGFIVTYVRGLQDFENARTAHKAAGENPERPTKDAGLINQYRQAAGLLGAANGSADAAAFPDEAPRAMIRQGLALYYAGDLQRASDVFEAAAQKAAKGAARRDALWYAIVTLDRAVDDGLLSAVASRDRLATLYLKEFPGSDNAAKLLLRQTRADQLNDRQAIDILLKVPVDSPLYEASRRQVARLLYQEFRRTSGTQRDFAATRFADVAEPLARAEYQAAMAATDQNAKDSAVALLLHARQLLDALLGVSAPDLQRVEAVFMLLDGAAAFQGIDLAQVRPELTFRRLQVAIAKGDEPTAQSLVDSLRGQDNTFSVAADRLMYRRALDRWKAQPDTMPLARQVVRHGVRLLELPVQPGKPDPVAAGVREAVAAAAAALHAATPEPAMRDLALRLDQEQLAAGRRTATSLRRLAVLLEETSDHAGALSMWQELLAGLDPASSGWYEARYQSIRLLARTDPASARTALDQHHLLHPEFGPEPWGELLKALNTQLAPALPASTSGGGK